MSAFRFDSGEERKVLTLKNEGRTIFVHPTTKASDTTMAVKYLKTRMEGEIASSPSLYSKFVNGELSFAVVVSENTDARLVEYFANLDHIPIRVFVVEMGDKDSANKAFMEELTKLPPVIPSDISLARMKKCFEAAQKPPLTGVTDLVYEEMMKSYRSTSANMKKYWHWTIYDANNNPSKVVYRDGELYDTNIQSGKLQKIKKVSDCNKRIYFTEAGERFARN